MAIGNDGGFFSGCRQHGFVDTAFDVSLQHIQQFDGARVLQPVSYTLGTRIREGIAQRAVRRVGDMVFVKQ